MQTERITFRTVQRIIRQAYELEYLANRLKAAGFEIVSDSVRAASSEMGHAGRALEDQLTERRSKRKWAE